MRTWLVTGGCGFIGSHLVEALLARGDQVRVLDDLSSGRRDNIASTVDLRIGDVADEKAVADALDGVDGCFHLAAVASVQRCTEAWVASHRTNVTGTVAILDRARRATSPPVPVVYASSAAVYGDNPETPLKETATTAPLSAYGVDKLACEWHARVGWAVHRVPSVGLRFFNVYGPRQDPSSPYSGVIAIFADRLATGRDVDIFGDGRQTRDFIYVADVVAHLIAAMSAAAAGARVYNVCTGRGVSLLELLEVLKGLTGTSPVVHHRAPRAGDIRTSIGDPSAATAALGTAARTTMTDGLRATLDTSDRK
ncbi:MAG TPA: NAD-dependent epimerase/dehydratase family protein [Vicinamibacterales bacterium]|nr:NAD-dependent epimerase/dehydratase family protein [Vicinamibacterales bacterium]